MTRADRRAEHQAAHAAALSEQLGALLSLRGDERVLDVGCGTGALTFAVAASVSEVVGVDVDASMVERALADAPANATFVIADGERLPFDEGAFDVAATLRTLHHTGNPALLVAELVRVTKPGGTVLIVDQLAPGDDGEALALNTFERARDATTSRVLPERELRSLFDRLDLTVVREQIVTEPRDLDAYLELGGCDGAERERVAQLAPPSYEAVVGWFVLLRP